jgi:hypothetical protein
MCVCVRAYVRTYVCKAVSPYVVATNSPSLAQGDVSKFARELQSLVEVGTEVNVKITKLSPGVVTPYIPVVGTEVPTQCIYVFRMVLAINSDCFPKQH